MTAAEHNPESGLCAPATCSLCGRPLRRVGQNRKCLRCLVSVAIGDEDKETEPRSTRLTPRALKYAQFEVEMAADGFPFELGAGAMAVTYRARDTVLNSEVALKVIDRSVARNPGVKSRFLREARAAAQIRHPNVARVSHYGEQDEECFYAMELVEGETLEARVRRDGPLPLDLALEIIEQTAGALTAAEKCGVVHRDIKPANIMLESDSSGTPIVKVIDYGVAKMLTPQADAGAEQTQAGFIGTPAFASPEQFVAPDQAQIDTRSDIYSLGLTFWYLLTGRTPFWGRTLQDIHDRQTEDLPWKQLKGRHIPAQCFALLKSMLAPDPKDRPQTARDLLYAIRRCHTKFSAEGKSLRRLRFALTAIGIVFVLVAWGAWWSYRQMRSSTLALPPIRENSIAVLPFENRSEDKAYAYLAEGIQDEILVRLSKIADLKVISNASTENYKSAPENLREIARQLGVAHVLEGSVQKSGDAVRVIVQLIKAADGSHLWADSYDRKLTDVFSVESDVAKATADQLRARLTGPEEQALTAKPTDNIDAYDAYMRGLAYCAKSQNTPANSIGAQKYLREAVRLDPKFALSWALLSYTDARGYLTSTLPATISLREEARQAAETALALQPDLGEAILAKGFYYYSCEKDYATAVRYFEQARSLLPNSSQVPMFLAVAARRRGQWDQSETYFNEAERIDPRNVFLLSQHAFSYTSLRRFSDASRKLDQVLNIIPDDMETIVLKAAIAQAEGDLPRAALLLAPLRPSATDTQALENQVYQAILERHSAPVIDRLKEILAKPDPALADINGELRTWLGRAQDVTGDHTAAIESYRLARSELEPFVQEQPENFTMLGGLAMICAALGDKTAAFSYVDKAMAAVPMEKDPFYGPGPIETLARVAAQTGETDRAVDTLKKLLSIPYGVGQGIPITVALLRLDPMFDPLRNDPRFKELLTVPSPKR